MVYTEDQIRGTLLIVELAKASSLKPSELLVKIIDEENLQDSIEVLIDLKLLTYANGSTGNWDIQQSQWTFK